MADIGAAVWHLARQGVGALQRDRATARGFPGLLDRRPRGHRPPGRRTCEGPGAI